MQGSRSLIISSRELPAGRLQAYWAILSPAWWVYYILIKRFWKFCPQFYLQRQCFFSFKHLCIPTLLTASFLGVFFIWWAGSGLNFRGVSTNFLFLPQTLDLPFMLSRARSVICNGLRSHGISIPVMEVPSFRRRFNLNPAQCIVILVTKVGCRVK